MLDVARATGVSPKTASRVVNSEPNVSAETSIRVCRPIGALPRRSGTKLLAPTPL
jgi:DNA-binding LacI/PurR family transcriptional regulator